MRSLSVKLGIPPGSSSCTAALSAGDKRLDAVLQDQLDDLKLQLKESQDEIEGLRNEASRQLEAARKTGRTVKRGEMSWRLPVPKARTLAPAGGDKSL